MILVDSSVWIEHFRRANARLSSLVRDHQVLTHSFVIGELACGTLPGHRTEVLAHLSRLPGAPIAEHDEVMTLIERRGLAGSGIGWVDAHLLASALLASASLWTMDSTLQRVASMLGVSDHS